MTVDTFCIGTDSPVLRDHQVCGRHVLPGPAYIDLLYQCFRDRGRDYAHLELRRLLIHRPLALPAGGELHLSIEQTPVRSGEWRIELKGAPSAARPGSDTQTLYASAQLLEADRLVAVEVLNLAKIRAEAIEVTPIEEMYAQCRVHEICHGPYMKAVGTRYVTEDAVYIDCELGSEARLDMAAAMFHPVLMDASAVCMGGIYEVRAGEVAGAPWLPLYFESFRAAALLQERCIARVRKVSCEKTAHSGRVSFEFFDSSGRQVAQLKDFVCKEATGGVSFEVEEAPAGGGNRVSVSIPASPRPTAQLAPTARSAPYEDTSDINLEAAIVERLRRKIGATGGAVTAQRSFYELGLASAALLELVADMEQLVGQKLPPTLLFEYTNAQDLAAYLSKRKATGTHERPSDAPSAERPVADDNRVAAYNPGRAPDAAVRSGRREPIAIIALAGRFPMARNLEELWDNLHAGRDCVAQVPPSRWDCEALYDADGLRADRTRCKWGGFIEGVDEFDPQFFGISAWEAQLLDPQLRLFLQTTWELLELAGYPRALLQARHGGRVGVYVGSMYQHYRPRSADVSQAALLSLGSYGAIANRISHILGLVGPSLAIDTACSSAGTAIHLACSDLLNGECELAIAGATNLSIDPGKFVGLSQLQLLGSHAGSRSFSQSDGYLPAESVGAVMLKPLHAAERDGDAILALIRATCVSHSGGGNSYTTPNLNAQATVMEATLARADVAARTISCVEAAANGSALGDAVELAALSKVFRAQTADEHFCSIGSVKSNLGHAEAASALTQLAKVVLQMQHGTLVPSIMSDPPGSNLQFEHSPFILQHSVQEWRRPLVPEREQTVEVPRRALVNSFGAGGSYACFLVEEYRREAFAGTPRLSDTPVSHIVVFSARSAERLEVLLRNMLECLERHPEFSLEQVAYTLQIGREAMGCRAALSVGTRDELVAALRAHCELEGETSARVRIPISIGSEHSQPAITGLFAGSSGEALLRSLLQAGNLEKIALLWCEGAQVPWSLLYDARRPQHVPLPTYPFLRERYWLELAGEVPDDTAIRAPDLVQQVDTPGLGVSLTDVVRAFVVRFLAATLEIDEGEIAFDRNLQTFGVDSIVGMHLLRTLQQRFGVHLSARTLFEQATIHALAGVVAGQMAALPSAQGEPCDPDAIPPDRQRAALQALAQFKSGRLDRNDIQRLIVEGELE